MSADDAADRAVTTPRRRWRGRKVRAILAGGLVLGIGAAITLAAWTDDEFAKGTFTAGQFNLQGATDGSTYADHNSSAGAAALSFSTGFNNMSPNQTVYAGFWLRLAAGTTSGANLQLAGYSGTGTATAQLTYTIYTIAAAATCNASTATGTPIATGTLSDTTATSTVVALAAPVSPAAGAAQQLCFAVTSSAALAQSSSATGTWQFTATSS
ncbi:SipW-dependent-type signal peptide-containing protein [Microbacterium candidum]|uniref:SipW-dependent-type signal peptide-containing protein n=1 Tax=Microbacterium candidum TaxID=3041922 RepID=A0ABT7MX18_9MICO|nr:SipW-dependent-type signal peptide-containing protein [Microbacterium sp. ASV49]MDL9978994.1 SipW-dependent-type signal peptide-containing protein [Microbacterium sp. ASV49]